MINTRWFLQTLTAAFITMIFIYGIKWFSKKFQVPVLEQISEGV